MSGRVYIHPPDLELCRPGLCRFWRRSYVPQYGMEIVLRWETEHQVIGSSLSCQQCCRFLFLFVFFLILIRICFLPVAYDGGTYTVTSTKIRERRHEMMLQVQIQQKLETRTHEGGGMYIFLFLYFAAREMGRQRTVEGCMCMVIKTIC